MTQIQTTLTGLPGAQELQLDPVFQTARNYWATNLLFSFIFLAGNISGLVLFVLALVGWTGWVLVVLSFFAAGVALHFARRCRKAALNSIATSIGMSGVPLEMKVWGQVRFAAHVSARVNEWHAERYGAKTAAELEQIEREDEAMRRELAEWDRSRKPQ